MITNGRVKELRRLLGLGRTLGDSARMAEMSEKTARKYRDSDELPSQQTSESRLSHPYGSLCRCMGHSATAARSGTAAQSEDAV